jgi:hypothetical protein
MVFGIEFRTAETQEIVTSGRRAWKHSFKCRVHNPGKIVKYSFLVRMLYESATATQKCILLKVRSRKTQSF